MREACADPEGTRGGRTTDHARSKWHYSKLAAIDQLLHCLHADQFWPEQRKGLGVNTSPQRKRGELECGMLFRSSPRLRFWLVECVATKLPAPLPFYYRG